MALTPSHLLHLSSQPPPSSSSFSPSFTTVNFNCIFVCDRYNITASLSPQRTTFCLPSLTAVHKSTALPVKCFTKSTDEDRLIESDSNQDRDNHESCDQYSVVTNGSIDTKQVGAPSSGESLLLGIREPVYEVLEVKANGTVANRKINRRQLLKSSGIQEIMCGCLTFYLPYEFDACQFFSSGLRPRDIRSVSPSLFLTNSMPSLLVREHAVLLNLASLRAIAMPESVLVFDYHRRGGQAFLDALLPRLNPNSNHGIPSMPFELEVVEAALLSRIQCLEKRLMALETRVEALLEVLPNRLNEDMLEQLRTSKQHLVELGSRAGALRHMLLDLLEDPNEIQRICIMGRSWILKKRKDDTECLVPAEHHIAEEAEEEIEMLLENYLQRCESCYGQAERLLDSTKEMEDSIAINLSSRRLEVGRVELLLQVWAFCMSIGALVTGIFGMNLKSYLEEHAFAFWLTTAGIIVGAVLMFFLMYSYLKRRKIM